MRRLSAEVSLTAVGPAAAADMWCDGQRLCLEHTTATDKTRLSCFVRVGGVNRIGLSLIVVTAFRDLKRFSKFSVADSLDLLPILFIPPTNKTRQDNLVLAESEM